MALPPPTCVEMGAFYQILGWFELSAAMGYTTPLKGRVKDPSAVIEPAGCTILHRRRCPCGEGSTSAIQPPSFATPSVSIPLCFSCRDTEGKSLNLSAFV